MPSESVNRINQMIRQPKPIYALASNGEGRATFVLLETAEPETGDDDGETPRRVVEGTADGGRGREDPPWPTKMNELVRELALGTYARTMRQGG